MTWDVRSFLPVPDLKLQTRNLRPSFTPSFTSSELPALKRLPQNPAITINFPYPKNQIPQSLPVQKLPTENIFRRALEPTLST